jgi:hypothetical protein
MALLEGKREEEDVALLDEDVQVLQGLQGLQGLKGLKGLKGLFNHLFSDNIMRQCAGKCKLHLPDKFCSAVHCIFVFCLNLIRLWFPRILLPH